MTFVSFAPNSEDVLLWRALKAVRAGAYVDVGACDPDQQSTTRAFYERGWSGLNIAMRPKVALPLFASRLRDVTLDQSESLIAAIPFAELLAAHAAPSVQFMRIDVDGDEHLVMHKLDFSQFRPWILLIRSIAPESRQATHAVWEPALLDAGYVRVWFDGINRFYLAEEKTTEFTCQFGSPANSLDEYTSAAGRAVVDRLIAAEARAEGLAEQVRDSRAGARETIHTLMETQAASDFHFSQIEANERAYIAERATHARRVAEVEQLLALQERRALAAEQWLLAVRRSTSWRVTAPMRALLRRVSGRPAKPSHDALSMQVVAQIPLAEPVMVVPKGNFAPVHALPQSFVARAPLRTIHQFHAGSARGDAITSAMLLIRKILRDLGYCSQIFCEKLNAVVGDDIRPIDELPLHGNYVLLMHFSLGFERIDQILALPAPKVLMYHNITPPELLAATPGLQQLARLGYSQLKQFRPHVAAALAVSEYNALDLRSRGFSIVRCCPLLFDINALQQRAGQAHAPRTDKTFTLLFVGRLVESKAQDDLVEMFAVFRRRFAGKSRLVLVGHGQEAGDNFASRLRARIEALGLTRDVVFMGVLDDHMLHQTYHEADIYVSLSHHEGFGVTLIEAMAHGVPVLAWPCGAVPDTLGGAAELLTDRSPEAVAARVLALATDASLRNTVIRRQTRELSRFSLDRQIPILLQALTLAGASLPDDPATRPKLIAGLHFQLAGHVNGSYSLAAVNRGLVRSIETLRPGRVRLVPVEGEQTLDISDVAADETVGMADLVSRPRPEAGPLLVISHHYPVHVPSDRGDVCLALFFWEESVIPIETVHVLNREFQGVLAPSSFVAKVLVDSGVYIPVHNVGQSPALGPFLALGVERQRHAAMRRPLLSFLHISSCMPRKGVDILLSAYVRAFRKSDPVRLVIKGFPNPHNLVPEQVAAICAQDPDAPEIVLLNGDLDKSSMLALYREADVMVLPTRGEGYNLPAAEAIAAALLLIATDFGGHMDFCTAATMRLVQSGFAPSGSHLASSNSLWAEPAVDDLVAALHEARDTWGGRSPNEAAARVKAASALLLEVTNDKTLVDKIEVAAIDCLMTPPLAPVRIAWITTWDVRCGVAEYARHLLAAWPQDKESCGHLVLADSRTEIRGDSCFPAHTRAKIAWHVGRGADPHMLIQAVAQEDPDIVVLQHQPGLLSWPVLGRILTSQALSTRAVAVTLHNTGTLVDIPRDDRCDVLTGLKNASRVIVHTVADLERLKIYGVTGNVVMMPHGVPEGDLVSASARPLGGSDDAVIGCYGFFLPGKGIPELIAAVGKLRQGWPKLRLRLVNAAYGLAESDAEIRLCQDAVAAAGLTDVVDWHTDFLPEAESRRLLVGCDLVVLPYQFSKEASSAALRSVLSTGVPVAVTPLAVFDDASDAVWRFEGITPDLIAAGIRHLLVRNDMRENLRSRAADWKSAHGWPAIAERMNGMLLGILQERRIQSHKALKIWT